AIGDVELSVCVRYVILFALGVAVCQCSLTILVHVRRLLYLFLFCFFLLFLLYVFSRSYFLFFSSRRRHTRLVSDWSSDVCSSDLVRGHLVHLHIRLCPYRSVTRGEGYGGEPDGRERADSDRASCYSRYPFSHRDQIGRASCRERV